MSDEKVPPRIINFLEQKQKRTLITEESSALELTDEEIYTFLYVLDILRNKSNMQSGEIVFTEEDLTVSILHDAGDEKQIGVTGSTGAFIKRIGAISFEWNTQEDFELLAKDLREALEEICL